MPKTANGSYTLSIMSCILQGSSPQQLWVLRDVTTSFNHQSRFIVICVLPQWKRWQWLLLSCCVTTSTFCNMLTTSVCGGWCPAMLIRLAAALCPWCTRRGCVFRRFFWIPTVLFVAVAEVDWSNHFYHLLLSV